MTDYATAMFSTPEMGAVFSDEARVRGMLAFEAALARAEAGGGVIPRKAADAIAAACRLEVIDLEALNREAALSATPVIAIVRMIGAAAGPEAAGYVHWGATSQDAIDTGMMLQVRQGLDLLIGRLLALGETCAALAEEHRRTLMPGRTLLQQALPISFGLKAARWLAMVTRQVERLRELGAGLVVQLGGAAGTLASLGAAGPRVLVLLAIELGLAAPELPWHAERDRVGEIAAALGVLAGSMAKVATDLALLAQTEVGEATEGGAPGKGRSSAMPQKRNPVDATLALASARLALGAAPVLLGAMAQEHERAAGTWQSEWVALPQVFCFTDGAVAHVGSALATLEVHAERMRADLDLGGGLLMAEALTMALAPRLGREGARQLVDGLCARVLRSGLDLRAAALADADVHATLSAEQIEAALDPARYLGSADLFIDRALEGFRRARGAAGAPTQQVRGDR